MDKIKFENKNHIDVIRREEVNTFTIKSEKIGGVLRELCKFKCSYVIKSRNNSQIE